MSVLLGAVAGAVTAPMVWVAARWCSRATWPRPLFVAGVVFVGCVACGGWAAAQAPFPVVWWPLLVVGVGAAVVDVVEHRLPDILVGAAAIGVAGGVLVEVAGDGGWAIAGWAAAAAGAAFVLMYGAALVSGMGFGDVKLAAVIAGCAGTGGAQAAVLAVGAGFLTAAFAGAAALALGASRSSMIALGPWLLLGAAISLAV